MIPMTYTDALNDLFRYTAPADSVHSIVQQAEAGGPVHHTNIGDGVLADYLEEHDDPRSEIVRRHLKRTEAGLPNVHQEIRSRLGSYGTPTGFDARHLGNGEHVFHYEYSDGDRRISHVRWYVPVEGEGTAEFGAYNRREYDGVFTPEEAAHIMSKIKPVSEGLPVPID